MGLDKFQEGHGFNDINNYSLSQKTLGKKCKI
jgi:hypothetical protein